MAAILFLMRYPLDGWDNLKTKFDGQMAAMEAMGHEAYCIGWSRSGMYLCRGQERTLLKKCPLTRMPGYSKTVLYIDLMDALKEALARKHFDVVYMRFMSVYYNAPGALKAVKEQGGKLIMEHPTYPLEKGRNTNWLRKPVFWYTDRVFDRLEPMIDLYTLIGDPCGETLHGIPAMNIVNGVNVDAYPLHQPRVDAPEIGMLALASMSYWQGYDRLIKALAAYQGPEKIRVLMVGGDGDGSLPAWKKLAEDLGVADRVSFLGPQFGQAQNEAAAQCDIGIGGLGLHRIGQYQSTTLKLREYMARGLPFVYAVDDVTIPDEPSFCMRLPNDDSDIDMEELVAFALKARQDAQLPARMRAYTQAHMSWESVLRAVLEKVGIH